MTGVTTLRVARRSLRIAQGGIALAVVLLVLALARRGSPLAIDPISPEPPFAPASSETADREPVDVARIVAGDPFSTVRAAPEVPYRIGSVPAIVARPVQAPAVRLVGTVVSATGRSFAMCQVANAAPKVVYPGQRVGALVLESVQQGSATFIDDEGARVVLRVPGNGR